MDHLTKEKLKHDAFVDTTAHGLEWASANRQRVYTAIGAVVGIIVLAFAVVLYANHRAAAAAAAFGSAMQTYQAPVAVPGQPADPGVKTYGSSKERSQAANQQFVAVADKYGATTEGKNARYMAGITFMELGQTASAESTLNKVAGSWDHELSTLAKEALADLYHQTGRDSQAVDLLKDITAHPSDAVPAGLAQIELAELYTDQGKAHEARKIYAQLKDKDKTAKGQPGPAAALAAQKLNPAPAGGPPPQF